MAGSVIGSLRVNLGLDSADFVKGAARANDSLGKMSTKMLAVGAAITAAVGGAAYEFVKLTRETINVADEISKAAVKIGVSTEELSRLRYAADLSGLSFEQLQKGLLILNRNMAGIGGESKKVSAAFTQMGIETRNADGTLKSSTEVLKQMADVFARMPDSAEKSALAMATLGKSGADMIPLLNGGAAELQKLTDEADRFGIVIDTETGRKAEQFNDNLSRLQGAFSALATRVAAELLPHLVDLTEWLIKNQGQIVRSVGNFGDFVAGVSRMASAVASGVSWMEERFGRLFQVTGKIINPLGTLVSLAMRLGRSTDGGPLMANANAMIELGTNAMETAKAFRMLGIEGGYAGKALGSSVGGGARAASAAIRPLRDEVRDLVERLFPELGTRAKMSELALLDQAAAQGKITSEIREQGRLRILGISGDRDVSDDVIGQGPLEGAKRVAASASIVNKSLDELSGKAKVQTVAVADSFAQMTQRITGALQGLSNSIKSGDFFGILGGVLDIINQLGSAGLFGQGFASKINAPRSFDGGGFTGMGARAGGLDGKGGFMAMLHPRETVVDHTKGGFSGGANINVTVGVDPATGNLTAFVDNRFARMAPAVSNAASAEAVGRIQRMQARRLA